MFHLDTSIHPCATVSLLLHDTLSSTRSRLDLTNQSRLLAAVFVVTASITLAHARAAMTQSVCHGHALQIHTAVLMHVAVAILGGAAGTHLFGCRIQVAANENVAALFRIGALLPLFVTVRHQATQGRVIISSDNGRNQWQGQDGQLHGGILWFVFLCAPSARHVRSQPY